MGSRTPTYGRFWKIVPKWLNIGNGGAESTVDFICGVGRPKQTVLGRRGEFVLTMLVNESITSCVTVQLCKFVLATKLLEKTAVDNARRISVQTMYYGRRMTLLKLQISKAFMN